MGIYKHFSIIVVTHFSHNTFHKISTPLAQFTTTNEVLNATKTARNSTQQKTYRIHEETKNNKNLINKIPLYVTPSSELYLNVAN